MNKPFKWESFNHFYYTARKRAIDQIGNKFDQEDLKNVCNRLFTLYEQLDAEKYINPTGFLVSRIKKIKNNSDYDLVIGEYKRKLSEEYIESFKKSLLKKDQEEKLLDIKVENKKQPTDVKIEKKEEVKGNPYKRLPAPKKTNDTVLKFNGLIPGKPGVYFLFDANKKLIYIGRSICLSNRVLGSFVERKAKYVKVMVTETKADAYIIEPYCILMYNPPSNSEFKTGDSPTFHLELPPLSDFIEPVLAPRQR